MIAWRKLGCGSNNMFASPHPPHFTTRIQNLLLLALNLIEVVHNFLSTVSFWSDLDQRVQGNG